MSVPYEASGRVAQKKGTRAALVDAAQRLFAEGRNPTVDEVADAAAISRTTAYRYFPNQQALLAVAFPETDHGSLLPDPPPRDVHTRLDLTVEAFARFNLRNEAALRAQLQASLQPGAAQPPLRQGRAIAWLEEALATLRSTRVDVHRLAVTIRAATGIESLAWQADIAGLTREEYVDLARWTARALLDAALKDARTAHRARQ